MLINLKTKTQQIMNLFIKIMVPVFLIIAMLLLIRGNLDNGKLSYQFDDTKTSMGGPFESSGSNSRFALTQAIVDDGSLFLDIDKAKFSSPDVSKYKEKYFTIFTPGVSFLGVPFYMLGQKWGMPQIFAYSSTTLFAIANLFLVYLISRKIGSGYYSSLLAGILFVFGTNALSYSTTYTQHHASTLVILLGLLMSLGETKVIKNIIFGALYGFGLIIDVPNGIIMIPLVLYMISKNMGMQTTKKTVSLKLKTAIFGLVLGLIPMIALFGWYNYSISGSPTYLAQFAGRTKDFSDTPQLDSSSRKPGLRIPFNTRNQMHGLYLFLFSDERSIVVYTPVVLLGIWGIILLMKDEKYKNFSHVVVSTALINLIIYSMFGDPWGGWAFGPRYLIPSLGLLCVGISHLIDKYSKKLIFTLLFFVITIYSISVNVLGATTTTLVPPKVEAIAFSKPIPYTYETNWIRMNKDNLSSSLIYNIYLKNKISSKDFTFAYTIMILLVVIVVYFAGVSEMKNRKYEN